MGTAQYQITNFNTDLGSAYKTKIDGNMLVAQQIAAAFQCYANSPTAMNVKVAPGTVFINGQPVTQASVQTSGTITAPSVNPRIDRVVLDAGTGVASIVTGAEAASPVPPLVPNGKLPLAQIALVTSSTVITNTMITDERPLFAQPPPPTSNLLINPNWLIDQINEGALYTVTGGAADVQANDGWSGAAIAAPGVFKLRRLADPDNAALQCLEITCTTIDASIGATDGYYIHTAIEGYDAAALMIGTSLAQSVTVSFNFKSNINGVYGVSVANSALNRSYVGSFTVADALEHTYSVTLKLDTAGTWLYDTGVGLRLRICLAAGSNFQAAAGSWGANNMLTTSSQVNFMSNVANIAYLKRIQLVSGTFALPFAPQDYQKELAKCQRYYWKTFNQGILVGQNIGTSGAISYKVQVAGITAGYAITMPFPVSMRAAPTMTGYNVSAANANWRNAGIGADSAVFVPAQIGTDGFTANNAQVAGDAVANLIMVQATANARLA